MQSKVLCVLLLVCALVLGSRAQAAGETCTMEPRSRINCGLPGVTQLQCLEKGCCFDDTVPGYPWCFHSVPILTPEPEDEDDGCLF